MSASNKGPGVDSRLQNLTNALYLNQTDDVTLRTGFTGNIVITGNVNIPGEVTVISDEDRPLYVQNHIIAVGTSAEPLTTPWLPVAGNVSIDGNANVKVVGNIAGITTLPAITGNVEVSGNVSIDKLPALGNVSITQMPAVTGNIHIYGNVDVDYMPNIGIIGNIAGITTLPTITGNVGVSGNVSITQMPGVTVSGNVSITQLPALGNVSITQLPSIRGNVNVDNFPSNVSITQMPAVTGNVHVYGNITATPDNTTNTLVQFGDSTNMQMDATDRLRVSQALDSWWYAPTVDDDNNYRYIESATGTNAGSLFIQNLASLSLTSGTDANGTITRISRRRHKMRPTTSIRFSLSINWNGYDANVQKRAGLFTNYNGTFFQVKDDLTIVCRRRLANGTTVEKTINRADFNVDPLDGSVSAYDLRPNSTTASITGYVSTTPVSVGPTTVYNVVLTVADCSKFYTSQKGRITGITPTTFNQVVMVEAVSGASGPGNITVTMLADPGSYTSMSSAVFTTSTMFEQGVFGFDFNGNRNNHIRYFVNGMYGRRVVHIENFDGPLSTPWSNAPAISTRCEVTNTAAPGYRPSLLVSSESATIEGPVSENKAFGTAYNNTGVVYSKLATQEYPLLGLALRTGEPYQRADLQPISFQLIDTHNINPQNAGVLFWRLLLNPTISGTIPSATNCGRASRSWAYTTANAITDHGVELSSGYCTQQTIAQVNTDPNFVNLSSNITYDDTDKIVLVVKMLAGGSSDSLIVSQMNFVELL